jgi:hypothetical protein
MLGELEDRRAQLLQRRVVELVLALGSRGSNDAKVGRGLDQVLEQRGLADACVPVNDEHGPATVPSGLEQPLEGQELPLPADQGSSLRRNHRRGSMPLFTAQAASPTGSAAGAVARRSSRFSSTRVAASPTSAKPTPTQNARA